MLELEKKKVQTESTIAQLRTELESLRKAHEEAQASVTARAQEAQAVARQTQVELDAQAVAAVVPAEACVESLRTIEALAADGEITIDAATELAGLIHEGRAPQALRDARKRANLEAEPGPYLLICGDLCRDLGDISAAREAYQTLIAAQPSKEQLAHARMGDLFLAFAERSTAAALQRDDAHFAATSDPAKAIETYAELVARFPDDPSFREELGELHERLGNITAAALAYTQAMVGYLGSDDVNHAVELAPKLLASHPNDGSAYELAARAFERAGRNAEAHSALDQALRAFYDQRAASDVERVCRHLAEAAEDPVPYRRELAGLLREAGDKSGAAEQLLEAAEKLIDWSRGADALQLLHEATAIAGDDEMVEERVNALTAKANDVQRSVDDIARGDLLVSKGQHERAAEAYRRALEENPHHAGAAYRLACLLMDHFRDYETAEQLLQNASEMRPDHAATRYRLALVKAARGHVVEAVELLIALARFDEANADFIEQFAERLEKDAEGGDVAAKYRLGIGYRELGRVDEALVILQSIQREHDYVVLCHNAIGLCLRRQGLDTAAAKRFTKAIETPGYPESQYHEALYNLGELYEAKNTAESLALALSSFEELYASDCTFKDVGDRIKAVKARMGAAERPKVKRLPTRTADQA
jgi:tetratricopeptide (TPR) repeat protein